MEGMILITLQQLINYIYYQQKKFGKFLKNHLRRWKGERGEVKTHKRTYEFLNMEESERNIDFFTRVTKLENQIKVGGKAQ